VQETNQQSCGQRQQQFGADSLCALIVFRSTTTQCVWEALSAADGFTLSTAQKARRINDIFLDWLQDVQLFSCLTVKLNESPIISFCPSSNRKCLTSFLPLFVSSGERPRKLYAERALNLPLGAELITGNMWYAVKSYYTHRLHHFLDYAFLSVGVVSLYSPTYSQLPPCLQVTFSIFP